jgi:UDP-GlcNAc:undecaprenyl-phosphate GlcNAc-1-phosphate transferase
MTSVNFPGLVLTVPAISYYYFPMFSFAIALVTLLALLKGKISQRIVDRPNQRSLHATTIPRIGGLALMAGVVAGLPLLQSGLQLAVLFPLGLLMAVSFLDDLRALPSGWRLLTHFLAAGGFMVLEHGAGIGIGYALIFIILMSIVWMINLFNFMDGSDGLAGGMACFGFGAYSLAAGFAGNVGLVSLRIFAV